MHKMIYILVFLVVLSGESFAAEIEYVGVNTNIDLAADGGTALGWHSSGTPKSLDIDGDNVLGTEGWIYCNADSSGGLNNPERWLPSYFTDSNGVGWDVLTGNGSEVPNAALFTDFPTAGSPGPNPPQSATEAWWAWSTTVSDMFQFTFNSNAPSELGRKTLRVGLLFGISPRSSVSSSFEQTFTITQTTGGTATAVSPALYNNLADLNAAFFDFKDIAVGDSFTINANTFGSGGFPTLVGVTFDTASHGTVITLR